MANLNELCNIIFNFTLWTQLSITYLLQQHSSLVVSVVHIWHFGISEMLNRQKDSEWWQIIILIYNLIETVVKSYCILQLLSKKTRQIKPKEMSQPFVKNHPCHPSINPSNPPLTTSSQTAKERIFAQLRSVQIRSKNTSNLPIVINETFINEKSTLPNTYKVSNNRTSYIDKADVSTCSLNILQYFFMKMFNNKILQ